MITKIKNALKGALSAIRLAFVGSVMFLVSEPMQPILNGIAVLVSAGLWTWGLVSLATGGASLLALLGWIFLGGFATSVLTSIAVRLVAVAGVMFYALAYGLYVVIAQPKEA